MMSSWSSGSRILILRMPLDATRIVRVDRVHDLGVKSDSRYRSFVSIFVEPEDACTARQNAARLQVAERRISTYTMKRWVVVVLWSWIR